jgi:hypothetical protein
MNVDSGSSLSFTRFTWENYFTAVGGADTLGISADTELNPSLTSAISTAAQATK